MAKLYGQHNYGVVHSIWHNKFHIGRLLVDALRHKHLRGISKLWTSFWVHSVGKSSSRKKTDPPPMGFALVGSTLKAYTFTRSNCLIL